MKKCFIVFTLLLFRITTTFAQQIPAIQWQKSLGGSSFDQCDIIIPTSDGGYISSWYTESNDGDFAGNTPAGGARVIKLSSTGQIQWQMNFTGTEFFQFTSVVETIDGDYVFSGTTSTTNGVVGGYGGYDGWVVKFSNSGSILWQKKLGGSDDDNLYKISKTADGGYIAGGWTLSNNIDVSGNHGYYDAWVVKLDANGNIEWQKCFGGMNGERNYSIQQTFDGGYIMSGETESNEGDVVGNHGSIDSWIVKLDSIGNIQWQRCLGGSGLEEAESMQQTADGGYVIASSTTSSDGDLIGNTIHGYWIVKLNGLGVMQWQKSLGSITSGSIPFSIQQTNDLGYIIAGFSGINDGDVTGNHGDADWWIVKLNITGNIDWQKSIGGSSEDIPFSIHTTPDGGYIIGGYSFSSDGDVDNTNKGLSDAWIIKLGENPVPLHLLSFTGNLQNNNVKLYWKTAEEQDLQFFKIERSFNGVDFDPLSVSIPAFNRAGEHNYFYNDSTLFSVNAKYVYYRLKMVDADQNFKYSNTLAFLINPNPKKVSITIFPNPVNELLNVNLKGIVTGKYFLEILNAQGQQLINKYYFLQENNEGIKIPIGFLSPGIYWLRLYSNEEGNLQQTMQFYKQ